MNHEQANIMNNIVNVNSGGQFMNDKQLISEILGE